MYNREDSWNEIESNRTAFDTSKRNDTCYDSYYLPLINTIDESAQQQRHAHLESERNESGEYFECYIIS